VVTELAGPFFVYGGAIAFKGAAPLPRVREERASDRFDQMAGTRSVMASLTDTGPSASRAAGPARHSGKERRRGWGKLSTPLPTRTWLRAGPEMPSPRRSYAAAVKEMSAADDCARSFPILGSIALLRKLVGVGEQAFAGLPRGPLHRGPVWRPSARNEGGPLLVPPSGVAKGRWVMLLFERLAELVGFGERGMRDCATPNSTRLPWANDIR
jgi:hypothetical protein